MPLLIVIGIIVLIIIWMTALYNNLVRLRNRRQNAFADIDVQLRQRHDLVPQLGITLVHQGVASKIEAYDEIVGDIGLNDEEVAYMGDDIVDIAVLSRVGLSAAPADAVREVRERVHWVAPTGGGAGAARDLLELILRAQGRWDAIVRSFTPEEAGRA